MSKITRKDFLRYSIFASASMLVPSFLKALGKPMLLPVENQKVLVVVQLSGGNDGLNTFIPYRDDLYYKNRPSIAYQTDEILKVTDEFGFNPQLTGLRKLFDNGDAYIMNEVGYPNPDHSHFRSMDIWTTASGSDEYINTGWLGRYLDASCHDCSNAHLAIEVEDSLGLALKGDHIKGLAIRTPERIFRATQDPFFKQMVALHQNEKEHNQASYLYKTMVETSQSVNYVYEKSKIYRSKEIYPGNNFGKNLKTIAELICSGSETKIYYISLSGFDTHARQKPVHERLLGIVSQALESFVNDLKKNNRFDSTLIMAFSEFGRRVAQNGSNGTDHGEANNLLLLSGALRKKGFDNQLPDLINMNSGNLGFKTDFRNVYATILKSWLNADDHKILGKKFPVLDFI